jgi:POT family proton-dependent oligopeptide transporter
MTTITTNTAGPAVADHGGIGGHPRGLTTLFFTEFWERFSYYGMRAILILFMTAETTKGGMALDTATAAAIYGFYTSAVYFMGIPGGWIADRLLGQRNAVLYGGILIALGHYSMAINSTATFYAGLVLIVLGTGLLKPNISSIVGQLYSADDRRRDAGFSIFYMGINMGAFFSPLVCGYLGQNVGWHWGFGAAGVGMTAGIIQYVIGSARLGNAGKLREVPKDAGKLWGYVIVAVIAITATFYFLWDYRDYVLLFGTIGVFWWLLGQARDSMETKRIWSIIAFFVFALLFWAGFEQAGSSLNLFADRYTENTVLGMNFPSSFFQSVNPLAIITLAPLFALLWVRLGSKEPSSPAKFMLGLVFLSLGFLVVAGAAVVSAQGNGSRVSPMWLLVVYVLHTIGELCLSPVGLSTVTKLAPERLVGSMMGVWFLAASLGNFVGGRIAGLFETLPLPQLFGAVFVTTGVSAVVLLFLIKPIRKLMGGVH